MSRLLLLGLLACYLVAVSLTYFDYVEPYLFPLHLAKNSSMTTCGNLAFGSYPDHDDIRRLKKMGVTVLVSLLNTNMPQEKALHAREQSRARSIGGIEVRNFPLNYLDIDGRHNSLVVERLTEFVRTQGNKKIYFHCYLGRHRVGLVRKKLLESGVIKERIRQ
jgi:hypothetical protein